MTKDYFSRGFLFVTEDCNLNCKYCYEKGKQTKNVLMSEKVAEDSIDFMIKGAKLDNSRDFSVTAFGGEPLLNFPIIKHLYQYGLKRSKEENIKFKLSIITNCTLFPEGYADFIKECKASEVDLKIQLSIDGNKETQDTFRVTKNNQSSFTLVEDTLTKYAKVAAECGMKLGKDIHIHSVITPETVKEVYNSYLYFKEKGFPHTKHSHVMSADWNDEVLKELAVQLNMMSNDIINRCITTNSDTPYQEQFGRGRRTKTHRTCGAGSSYCAINALGNIYVCHRLYFYGQGSLNKKYLLGTIYDDYADIDKNRQVYLNSKVVHMKGETNCGNCSVTNCVICMAENEIVNGDMTKCFPQYCKMSRVYEGAKAKMESALLENNIVPKKYNEAHKFLADFEKVKTIQDNMEDTIANMQEQLNSQSELIQSLSSLVMSLTNLLTESHDKQRRN